MSRFPGTDKDGREFDDVIVNLVWNMALEIKDRDPHEWRRDKCGKLIYRDHYRDRSSSIGWEIDHVLPLSKGGRDIPGNLQPLHWEHNEMKGDTYPWKCPKKSKQVNVVDKVRSVLSGLYSLSA